jgi:hypothetical protein
VYIATTNIRRRHRRNPPLTALVNRLPFATLITLWLDSFCKFLKVLTAFLFIQKRNYLFYLKKAFF